MLQKRVVGKTRQYAIDLFKAVMGRVTRRPSLDKWEADFDALLNDLDGNHKLLRKVLKWYCKHAEDKYTPVVWSASSFRTKFDQIVLARKRWKENR